VVNLSLRAKLLSISMAKMRGATRLPPGSYTWGAYLSKGLEAKFAGSAGIGGNPPYPTADGKGAWGADHGEPIDVAADKTGRYFLWASG